MMATAPERIFRSPRLTLRARYIFPVVGRPIPDGYVTIDGDRIVAVGPCRANDTSHKFRDLGNVAILPGLVNAHVHLDFSDLPEPLGAPGIHFVDWIRRVMDNRRQTTVEYDRRIMLGLQETIRCGVTTLGNIAQPGWPVAQMAAAPLNATVFQELIAPTADRVAAALELVRQQQEPLAASHALLTGLSPHAPYTVHPELLSRVVALSISQKLPLAMHLAESREELELLQHGTGPLRTFLEELGAWDPTTIRPNSRPIDYLRLLALAHRTLVVHGNYLDDDEIAFLAAHAQQMAVVYCPRTHHWFAHRDYPLQEMLAAGLTMALGTDGRGSSPDLSLLAEMRFAARQHPDVGLDRILQMGTIFGAKALGRERWIGSIEPGKQADLTVVALPDRDATDPHELLFNSEEAVVGSYFRGRTV